MQKTAYEMRISDWSSDVCSSDLMYRPPVGREGGLVQRFRQGRVGMHDARNVLGTGAELHRHHRLGNQTIGRASCRARVCQYVWISQVAVSLKTMNYRVRVGTSPKMVMNKSISKVNSIQ